MGCAAPPNTNPHPLHQRAPSPILLCGFFPCRKIPKDLRPLRMLALLLLTFSSSSSSTSSLAGSRKCKKGYLHCMNGRCVASRYWCDGVDNCGDNSDEVPCNSECLPGTRPAAARALSAAWDRDSGFRRELPSA